MIDVDLYFMARVTVVTLSALCIVLTVVKNWRALRSSDMTFGYAILRLGIIGLLAAVGAGTLEVLLGGSSQTRVWMILAALTWMTVGLVWSIRNERD